MIRTQSDHANKIDSRVDGKYGNWRVAMINHALALTYGQVKKNMRSLCMIGIWPCWQLPLGYIDQPANLYRQHSSPMFWVLEPSENRLNWIRPHVAFAKYWNLIESSQEQAKIYWICLSVLTEIISFVTIMDVPLKEHVRDGFVSMVTRSSLSRLVFTS